ncbi:MAG: Ig-like domain-containing protein, partial [Gemmatimonadaceae bacterium]
MDARLVTVALLLSLTATLAAQEQRGDVPRTDTAVARLVVEPTSLTVRAGDFVPITVTAFDAQGNELRNARVRVSGPRSSVMVSNGQVKGLRAGRFEIVASASGPPGTTPVVVRVPITVTWPPVMRVAIIPEPGRLYTGVTLAHSARALHADSSERRGATISWRSSDERIASVDRFGNATAHRSGPVTITAESEGVRAQIRHTV